MSQMKQSAVTKKRPLLVEENEVNVVEETQNGCINERREFRDDIEEKGNRPCTLSECVSNGVLHMDQAARVVWKKKKDGTFNRAVYDQGPIFDELDEDDDEHWWKYNFLALRLLGEINRSTNQRISRSLDFKKQPHLPAPGAVVVDINKASNVWRIEASPPFLDTSLGLKAGNGTQGREMGRFRRFLICTDFLLAQDSESMPSASDAGS
ncbi:unnamed protein product [Cylicocyclus nassatus]|uniref:Uncharacterized protein n=1 Tax=Cylicocyclus nassatus TaxID=53992 RepID=A0AA36M7L1_CYLNA|nr:unnamed protein product [Cylicocyclus nassatus]